MGSKEGGDVEANAVRINPDDNVAVAIREIQAGEAMVGIGVAGVTANADIPRNHKIALSDIAEDEAVIKYGEPIGLASAPIRSGDWVHTHNLKSGAE